ncbi:recombination regulator RecX [Mesobacillus subterraneus]|uniref:recombination regulator RecX n=1 Tax=Mesobacillus subterraneus TaxID=285983 RepID=UPI00203EA079|nr:recombination regulator RecX [Mesobacillus subterraneus]MCM3667055.1 recombination regulator RecX [Mesobacillus subterraneus]MCM3685026.1 recombination regulator RecX [Mesobacillus subterraneus]
MPVISKITVQKHNKDRYSIFTDSGRGEEYAFSVDEDVLIKYQLKKGMELDDFAVTEVLFQDDIRKAYNTAINYLAHRMRSEYEVRDYLKKKEVADPVIKEAVHKLYELKFLNDEEFANAFVRTQLNTTDKGAEVIKMELKEKRISPEIISKVVEEVSFDDQLEKAIKLSEKYAQKNKKDSSRILKQKIEQMLQRKGYSFAIIRAALDETDVEKENDDEMDALRLQGEKLHNKYSKLPGREYRQKMKMALYRKGFPMEMIDEFISEKENED